MKTLADIKFMEAGKMRSQVKMEEVIVWKMRKCRQPKFPLFHEMIPYSFYQNDFQTWNCVLKGLIYTQVHPEIF